MNVLKCVDPIQVSTEVSVDSLSFDFNPDMTMSQHLGINNPSIDTNTNIQKNTQFIDIEAVIDEFQPEPKPLSASVLEYWQSAKQDHTELYKLALVIFSIPPTKVQIERDFSLLKFVFSDRRCSIASERLEEIMLIHLNKDLFELVNHEAIEELRIRKSQ